MNPLRPCPSCTSPVRLAITMDGFFEVACKSCGSCRSWRVPGFELPMSLDIIDERPRWDREPRKQVTEEQRAANLRWRDAVRRSEVSVDDEDLTSSPQPPRQRARRGAGARPPSKGTSPATTEATTAVTVEDLDEFVAEVTAAPEGMTQREIWREQGKSAT